MHGKAYSYLLRGQLGADLSCMVLLYRDDDEEIERFFGQVATSFQMAPYPDDGQVTLIPRRLEAQRTMLEDLAARRSDPLEVLRAFNFSRIVGTRGHLRRFAAEVLVPMFGGVSVCGAQPCCMADDDPDGYMDALRDNMLLFQVLTTARRLLRGGESATGIGPDFVSAQRSVLERRGEVPPDVIDDPVPYLQRLGRQNLQLMQRLAEPG